MAFDLVERLLDLGQRHVLRSDVTRLDSLRDVVLFVARFRQLTVSTEEAVM